MKCQRCPYRITDIACVVCDVWLCEGCLKQCVQCEQQVCSDCYKEDSCCLVRPYGDKTARHLKDFYENIVFDGDEIIAIENLIFQGRMKRSNLNEIRKEVLTRSVLRFVENFDHSGFTTGSPFASMCFPRFAKYVENEETRAQFVTFLEGSCEEELW